VVRISLNSAMRGGTVIVLLGLTALGAYSLGRQDTPTGKPSAAVVVMPPTGVAKPAALAAVPIDVPPTRRPASNSSATSAAPDKPTQSEMKRGAEAALTAAAIAAIIIKASRDQYHATGRPCACPDDLMRNGRACGGRSAYSRPGGAAPLCYPTDVTAAMIDAYRKMLPLRGEQPRAMILWNLLFDAPKRIVKLTEAGIAA